MPLDEIPTMKSWPTRWGSVSADARSAQVGFVIFVESVEGTAVAVDCDVRWVLADD
jgi:hypothetical protein